MTNFALRLAWPCLALAFLVGGIHANAAHGDTEGLNLDSHPGPAVWIEEHWDVIPDRLDEFLAVYDREIYALARQTPGYRGYTVATTIPDGTGEPEINCGAGLSPGCGHLGAMVNNQRLSSEGTKGRDFKGRLKERAVNWDGLFQHAFNVLIIHNVQTWEDGDRFRARMAELYAGRHPGQTLAARIVETLDPLATVYWDAEYRLIRTNWPELDAYTKAAGPRKPTDADGLDLEPRHAASVLVGEHWDVKPENLCRFLEAYDRDVIQANRKLLGYRGYSIATSLPPQPCETISTAITPEGLKRLGGGDELYAPGPSVRMDGVTRSDIRINAGALYKKTFTVIVRHQLRDWALLKGWSRGAPGNGGYEEIYARDHDGQNIYDVWMRGLFALSENHTDTVYRLIKTSFAPGSQGPKK